MRYYNLPNEKLPFGFEHIGNHWQQPPISRPQGHPKYHWLHTESGQGIFSIKNEKTFILQKNQGILMRPFLSHHYEPHDKTSWITSFVTFNGFLSDSLDKILGTSDYIIFEEPLISELQDIIDEFLDTFDLIHANELLYSEKCYHFLLKLGQSHLDTLQIEDRNHDYIKQVLEYIHTHEFSEFTVETLAKELFVSPQYLSKIFHRFTGKSTIKFLTDLKIDKAKKILTLQPNLSITELANTLGFSSSSHFIATFKKYTTITPKAFRQLFFGDNHGNKLED
ncbi:hypothetical protein RyT2_03520 [Pseudolactococcus yaeyamensis]